MDEIPGLIADYLCPTYAGAESFAYNPSLGGRNCFSRKNLAGLTSHTSHGLGICYRPKQFHEVWLFSQVVLIIAYHAYLVCCICERDERTPSDSSTQFPAGSDQKVNRRMCFICYPPLYISVIL